MAEDKKDEQVKEEVVEKNVNTKDDQLKDIASRATKERKPMSKARKRLIGGIAAGVMLTAVVVPTTIVLLNNRNFDVSISLNLEGEENSTSINVKKGTLISELKVQEYEGYVFEGWFKDKACTIKYENNEKLNANSVLYAKYSLIEYDITFENSDYYTITSYSNTVKHGNSCNFFLDTLGLYTLDNVYVMVNGIQVTPTLISNERTRGTFTIQNVKEDLSIVVNKVSAAINLYIDGQLKQANVISGLPIDTALSNAGIKDNNSVSINEYTTCGFYSDEALTQYVDPYTTKVTEGMTLYTKMATLDKLTFTTDPTQPNVYFAGAKDKNISGEVVVPKRYDNPNEDDDGYPVNFLSDSAFQECVNITKVTLPYGIDSISTNAFMVCLNLETVNIPESCKVIRTNAFYNCPKLSSIAIPAGVLDILPCAFQLCSSLQSVTIPNDSVLVTLQDNAFNGCVNLTTISTLPQSLVSLGVNAFNGCAKLTSINIPSKITIIQPDTFNSCTALETVVIPSDSNLEIINANAFMNCTALKNITLPSKVNNLIDGCFANCTSLVSINIPKLVTSIPFKAFTNCTSLAAVNIEEGSALVVIQGRQVEPEPGVFSLDGAFAGCTSLASINLPNTLTTINVGAFAGCTSLQTIAIPASVTIIEFKAFENCTNLHTVSIASGSVLSTINFRAFANCEKLANITLPNQLTTIQFEAFTNTALTSVNIPATVTLLNHSAFSGCANLTSVEFAQGSTLEIIHLKTFQNCVRLRSITLPDTIKEIGERAFEGCRALMKMNPTDSYSVINLPKSLVTLGTFVFNGCISISTITIPADLIKISEGTFANCTGISNIVYSKNADDSSRTNPLIFAAQSFENAFSASNTLSFPSDVAITVEINAFVGANINILNLAGNLAYIHPLAFNNAKIKKLVLNPTNDFTIPTEVAEDGDGNITNVIGMFESNTTLEEVEICGNVVAIQQEAFRGCVNLKSVTFIGENKVVTIGDNAFSGCTSLTEFTIPSGVTGLGLGLFSGCTALESVFIPKSVVHISGETAIDSIFLGCNENLVVTTDYVEGEVIFRDTTPEGEDVTEGWITYWNYISEDGVTKASVTYTGVAEAPEEE